MSNQWIQHEGRKILLTSYAGLSSAEMLNVLIEQKRMIKSSSFKVLVLSDFTNAFLDNEFMVAMKNQTHELHKMIEKSAVLGIYGAKEVLLMTFNASVAIPARPFTSRINALDYLANGNFASFRSPEQFYGIYLREAAEIAQ